ALSLKLSITQKTNKLALVLKTYSFIKEDQIKMSFHTRKDIRKSIYQRPVGVNQKSCPTQDYTQMRFNSNAKGAQKDS
ncbi:MAG: hypothetical protein COS89_04950, partial [Deltaproteobacteria bacterium CG07_land_8_20_14_0_80_38_7]